MAEALVFPLDPRNPGQVFACCGILELLFRLEGPKPSWFQLKEPASFQVEASQQAVREALENLKRCQVAYGDDDSVTLLSPFHLRLDWWTERAAGTPVPKTWAGGVRPRSFFPPYQQALSPFQDAPETWFEVTSSSLGSASPCLDPREFTHNLDTGFSTYSLHLPTASFVYVQVLALVGLQRFRPQPQNRHTFSYYLWQVPMLPQVAALVFAGHLPLGSGAGFSFRLRARDQENRYKAFSYATKKGGQP